MNALLLVAALLWQEPAAPTAAAPAFTEDLLQEFAWHWIGPAATGGRIVDIEAPAGDSFTLYVASATGGLYRSRNHGITWEGLFDQETSFALGDIALDPNDPEVIWVGTGEANNQRSSYAGDGIYRSTDGGRTWQHKGLRQSHHIGRIVVDPRDSRVVYVAVLGNLYTPNAERGLYKTTDAGDHWQQVLAVNEDVGVVDVVLHPDAPDTLYAASYERRRRAWDFDGAGPGSGIWKSTDAGATWTRLEGGLPGGDLGRIGLAMSAQDPLVVYATVSNQNPAPAPPAPEGRPRLGIRGEEADGGVRVISVEEESPAGAAGIQVGDLLVQFGEQTIQDLSDLRTALDALGEADTAALVLLREDERLEVEVRFRAPERGRGGGGQIGGEIYRSEDGGVTWTRQNEQPIGGSPAYYYGQIRVDPNDDQRLFVLSVPVHHSRDGGRTWDQGSLAEGLHVDHHALWVDPADSRHMVLGNDGGLAVTFDSGEHWDHVNNLPLAQFYAIALDDRVPYSVYGGTQDNGSWMGPSRTRSRRGAGNGHWTNIGGGDGFYVQVDTEDPDIVYYESQFGGIGRLDLRTRQSTSIRPPRGGEGAPADRFNWMSPILVSRHNPHTIYFGGNRLFRSLDRGGDWRAISPDLTTQDAEKLAGNVPHCTITTVAESPFEPGRLLVGTDDGNVQWTDDGGATWTNLVGLIPDVPLRWWVSRVEFSAHERDTAYVSFTGYREDDLRPLLYRTTDAGENWESIVGDLPQESINVVRDDPHNPDVLYVGTERSAYASIDRGGHWIELSHGLPTTPVHDLAFQARERELVAGTHGRGMFLLDVGPFRDLKPGLLEADAHLFAPTRAVLWRSVSAQAEGFSGDRPYVAANSPGGARLAWYVREDQAEGGVTLRVEDPAGEVMARLEVPATAGLHQANWNLRRQREEAEGGEEQDPRQRFRRGGGAPMVGPGTYTVVLTVGETEHRRPLVVEPDPLDQLRGTAPATFAY